MEKKLLSFLFIFFDPGETFALLPVIQKMQEEGIACHILSIAHSADLLKQIPFCTFLEACTPLNNEIPWTRDRILTKKELTSVVKTFDPENVVSGMVSKIQFQLASAFKEEGSKLFCYYDNFTELNPQMVQYPFLKLADITLASCQWTSENLQNFSPSGPVYTVGQPTLETWQENIKKINIGKAQKEIGIAKDLCNALFVGGYGIPYEEVLELLLASLEGIQGFRFWISLHPKSNGEIEKKLMQTFPKAQVSLIPKAISTNEAAAVMDLIICHFSTVGIQALSIGKPVVFIQCPHCIYPNLATDLGLSKLLQDKEAIQSFLTLFLKKRPDPLKIQNEFITKSGMPKNACERIYQNLITASKVTPQSHAG